MRWKTELLTEWAENENLCEREGDRKIATEEVWRLSNVIGSLCRREHLEGLSVHAHTCERTLAGSAWLCWYALRESHWETDVPHSITQVGSTHMHACTHAHLQTCKQKIYSYVHKQRGLATFCQPDGPKISACFSRHKHLHFSLYFSFSEEMSASWTLVWSCSPCKYIFTKFYPFTEILMYARKTLHIGGWVYRTHAYANMSQHKHTANRWTHSHTDVSDGFWHHLSGCCLKWDDTERIGGGRGENNSDGLKRNKKRKKWTEEREGH